MGGDEIIEVAWQGVCDCFYNQHKNASLAEKRYLEQLENLCLTLWVKLADQTVLSSEFKSFLEDNSAYLLQIIETYLR
jgi:hypothetical protein